MTHSSLAFFNPPAIIYAAPVAAGVAILAAHLIGQSVRKRSEGDARMVEIASAVRTGAAAYLKRQYRVVAIVFAVLVVVLGGLWALGLQPALTMVGVPIAGVLSGLCGWLGMRMATDAGARTAWAAKQSLGEGLTVAFRSGAVLGLNVVGFALLDASVWFLIFSRFGDRLGIDLSRGEALPQFATVMLSFGMGASLQALFARVGGGIFTKAADVGGDLVGKIEAGIPEDDPRNPATIADNVGDNVGDVAGMGADLYESYYGSILAAIALGAAAAFSLPDLGDGVKLKVGLVLATLPLVLAAFGVLASLAGIFAVRTSGDSGYGELLAALRRGVFGASTLIVGGAFLVPWFLMASDTGTASIFESAGLPWWGVSVAIIAGLVSGLVIAQWTEHCTSYENPPTRRVAMQAFTGPATLIIAGMAEGMKSTWASILAVVAAILVAFIACNGNDHYLLGLYGVGVAAVGMLSTLGITLATDAYGPIADNAGGNAEMSGQPEIVRRRTDMLDSLGNTTAATGKGFAIGSAALTAMALLAAYVQVVQTQLHTQTVSEARTAFVEQAALLDPGERLALWMDRGRAAIVARRGDGSIEVDGAMLIPGASFTPDEHFEESMKFGTPLDVGDAPTRVVQHEGHTHTNAGPERTYDLTGKVSHGDHEDEFRFRVVSTRNASVSDVMAYYDVSLTSPKVLAGLFVGVMLTFLFCALTMNAVGRAAFAMLHECRRQFGIMRTALRSRGIAEADIADARTWPARIEADGVSYPDYATCISISTARAQREMIVPSVLAVSVPLIVGLLLSVPGVIGLLAGGLTSGFAVAVFMANAGGTWDNAKKLLESYGRVTADEAVASAAVAERLPAEIREGLLAKAAEMQRAGRGGDVLYGKGSDDHKAAVVGDTVGDPFKDTSGPSLNILIKLISIVAVVFAGLVVKFGIW